MQFRLDSYLTIHHIIACASLGRAVGGNTVPAEGSAIVHAIVPSSAGQIGVNPPKGEPTTVVTTSNGHTITAIFTPTTLSGLGSSNKATTITTTDNTGATVLAAVAAGAAGAAVGAGGAAAAWLWKPAPGAPAPPPGPPEVTNPPTQSEGEQKSSSSTSKSSSSSTEKVLSCPLPTVKAGAVGRVPLDPSWDGHIPAHFPTSSAAPACTSQGADKKLLSGTDPALVKELAGSFCQLNPSNDVSKSLRSKDLPDSSTYKNRYPEVTVDFEFKKSGQSCPLSCIDSYKKLITTCQYNSHVMYGNGAFQQGCGSYKLSIAAEPKTELSCTGQPRAGNNYDFVTRDEALREAAKFCKANAKKEIKREKSTWMTPKDTRSDFFSVEWAERCSGSGASYVVDETRCNKYLSRLTDDCDTNTREYKHGGKVTDVDNCGVFKMAPKNSEIPQCWPGNKEISPGAQIPVKRTMALDAINRFCDRSGQDSTTIDPSIPHTGFVHDSCRAKGMASCGSSYNTDGSANDNGPLYIRFDVSFWGNDQPQVSCKKPQKYEIKGESCKKQLSKIVDQYCDTNTQDKKNLGYLFENGDNGCVRWNMWATEKNKKRSLKRDPRIRNVIVA